MTAAYLHQSLGSSESSDHAARPMLMDQNAAFSSLLSSTRRVQPAQAEEHQADAEHAVHAEQGGVAVDRRRVEALHVVEGERRVDEEAEEARADQVPERHGDEEQDRPSVACDPRLRVACR